MTYAVLDVETTTFQKGNPYSARNRLCYVGLLIDGHSYLWPIEYDSTPYREALDSINLLLRGVDRVVGFNLKFDLGWLKRYGIIPPVGCDIWDCQLAEFLSNNQSIPYPSLASSLSKYGLPPKSDIVEREYWANGIDTPEIPVQILETYLKTDLEVTNALYQYQLDKLPVSKRNLFRLQNQDLQVLLEMEANGILFNYREMEGESTHIQRELESITKQLCEFTDNWPHFNWNSGDHLSCLLYGGTISVKVPHQVEQVCKTGLKAGELVTRNRWETVTKTYPGLFKPIPGSELKKDGYWSVDEQVIRQLQGNKKLIDLLLKHSELEKYLSTYLIGIPKHLTKYDWQDGVIHGTFNQCRVITGRLSSEKPNQQNFPESLSRFITSRY